MIKIENLYFSYNNKIIFSNLNYEFSNNKIQLITGKNGSGKTTLLKLISKEIIPEKGEILNSENTNFISSTPRLYDNLKVIEQLNFLKKQINIKEIIKTYYLDEILNQKIKELSSGQKQYFYLLTKLLIKKDYFFLDEPFTNLDSNSIKTINNLISNTNSIFIINTHNINNFNKLTYKNIKLEQGELIDI